MLRKLACTVIFLAFNLPHAMANPRTFACQFKEGSDRINELNEVDQVVIDAEANFVELRVARTMGTDAPVNWTFANREGPWGVDTFGMRETPTGTILGAGLSGYGAHSFALKPSGELSWINMQETRPVWFRWQCQS